MLDQLVRVCALGFSGGKASNRLGRPFEYRRPGDPVRPSVRVMRPSELARHMRG